MAIHLQCTNAGGLAHSRSASCVSLLLAAALLMCASAARADAPETAPSEDLLEDSGQTKVTQPEPELIGLGDGLDSLTNAELNQQRAKAMIEIDKIFITEQDVNGTVSGNVATNNVNGDNIVSGTAFSGASGIVSSVQNTGNNVLIQNATIVTVTLEQ